MMDMIWRKICKLIHSVFVRTEVLCFDVTDPINCETANAHESSATQRLCTTKAFSVEESSKKGSVA